LHQHQMLFSGIHAGVPEREWGEAKVFQCQLRVRYKFIFSLSSFFMQLLAFFT
jgi:hypothetical protein